MHDTWARYYDFVYNECFGTAFWRLTAETLALVTDTRPAPARVLDLGAGTGRIAIPLALLGYEVTAIECSNGMADVLDRRAGEHGVRIDLRRADLRTLSGNPPASADLRPPAAGGSPRSFDLAIATFTVLNYLVADEDLDLLAVAVAGSLEPGGRFVFDIASRRLFASALFESERLHREIDVRQLSPDVFRHRDTGCGSMNGQRFQYDETFTFRYWRDDEVLERFARAGLTLREEVTPRLRESGSRWFVLER